MSDRSRRFRTLSWLESRTGGVTGVRHVLDEDLPPGVGWSFTTGSVVLLLLAVQLLTGIALMVYYVPAPEHAYDSVRFIMTRLRFGWLVRALHVFGASFIVVAALVHMTRVVVFGSYKRPREMTWVSGVALLLIILGLALSGYLLPWDQKAYWATTVTINVARSTPLLGELIASLIQGGADLGVLTLGRWYAAHVVLLPAALIGLTIAHLYLMRRHGISGPISPRKGPSTAFYPAHVLRDTIAGAIAFAAMLTLAVMVPAPLDEMANPVDATYVPRPEWYFLWLFQLLKYFPGRLEPVATIVIPGLLAGGLLLLPFLDRSGRRHPLRRVGALGTFVAASTAIAALTWLGLRDSPAHAGPAVWGPIAIAGKDLADDERCRRCHVADGHANVLQATRITRDPEWLFSHVGDPEIIAPGLRKPPPGGMNEGAGRAILAYLSKVRSGAPSPDVPPRWRTASRVFATRCAQCHSLDGDGSPSSGGDLSRAGRERDAAWLEAWIADPAAVDENAEMPAFGDRLSAAEMSAIVQELAARK